MKRPKLTLKKRVLSVLAGIKRIRLGWGILLYPVAQTNCISGEGAALVGGRGLTRFFLIQWVLCKRGGGIPINKNAGFTLIELLVVVLSLVFCRRRRCRNISLQWINPVIWE